MSQENEPPNISRARRRRWIRHLWREWIVESRRLIAPAFARPDVATWRDDQLTASWLGHATVLIDFFGINIITDPALLPRVGIRIPFLATAGPKRLTAPALTIRELPRIDIVLLSHAHFDHFDLPTLRAIARRNRNAQVVTAAHTADLLCSTRLRRVTELGWHERQLFQTDAGPIEIEACPVKHWGARVQHDTYRGYNAYLIERNGRRVLFGADTAFTEVFGDLRKLGGMDLAIMSIGAYDPWIRAHSTPEQAIQMANDAGAKFIMPIHHQTFRLSGEPFREPIERFEAALKGKMDRIALREIGQTFVIPT